MISSALLRSSGELRQQDDCASELFGHDLDRSGNSSDLFFSLLYSVAAHTHQLEIVDDDKVESAFLLLIPAAFVLHLDRCDR